MEHTPNKPRHVDTHSSQTQRHDTMKLIEADLSPITMVLITPPPRAFFTMLDCTVMAPTPQISQHQGEYSGVRNLHTGGTHRSENEDRASPPHACLLRTTHSLLALNSTRRICSPQGHHCYRTQHTASTVVHVSTSCVAQQLFLPAVVIACGPWGFLACPAPPKTRQDGALLIMSKLRTTAVPPNRNKTWCYCGA